MAEAVDWNRKIIDEFRANGGRVGGPFHGAPLVLLHHRGRKSGQEHVSPVMYMPGDDGVIYVFASKSGSPDNPSWYYNLTSAGRGEVEVGTEAYPVTVEELTGEERDRVYAQQSSLYKNFTEYEAMTAGIRTIPVLALRRS